jgi:hypothetical protein
VWRWTGSRIHLHVPLRGAYSYTDSHSDFNSATYSHAPACSSPEGSPDTASATLRKRRLTQTPYNDRTVAEVGDFAEPKMLPDLGGRDQRHAATAVQILVRSVVFGQKTEFSRNLLPIFMQYVSE